MMWQQTSHASTMPVPLRCSHQPRSHAHTPWDQSSSIHGGHAGSVPTAFGIEARSGFTGDDLYQNKFDINQAAYSHNRDLEYSVAFPLPSLCNDTEDICKSLRDVAVSCGNTASAEHETSFSDEQTENSAWESLTQQPSSYGADTQSLTDRFSTSSGSPEDSTGRMNTLLNTVTGKPSCPGTGFLFNPA